MVLSLLCCVCSVLSKEQGITVIAVCYTYDLFIVRNVRPIIIIDNELIIKY